MTEIETRDAGEATAEAMETSTAEPELMIGDIPERYFRAFIGKNSDYYIPRFRFFKTLENDKHMSCQTKMLRILNINYSVLIINFFMFPYGFYFFRKLNLLAFLTLTFIPFFYYLHHASHFLFFYSIYFFILFFLSTTFNYTYYRYCTNKIKKIISLSPVNNKILYLFTKKGGTSLKFLYIIFLIIFIHIPSGVFYIKHPELHTKILDDYFISHGMPKKYLE